MRGEKRRLIIIDSNSIIHRAFHALPPLTTKKGEVVGAIYGFLLVFLKAIREFRPDFIAACFDFPGPTFRHKEFKEYKAKRPPAPKELYNQIPKVKKILTAFNVPIFEKEGFEADDIIGTISRLAPRKQIIPEIETIILSGDLDVLQLVDKNTKVYTLKKGLKDTILYDEKTIQERYGLSPSQLIDFKALRGDPSDNIPGVLGVGEKTAAQLIKQFGSLGNLYHEIENKTEKAKEVKPAVKERLIKFKEQAFFSKMLVQIKRDALINFDLQKCQWNRFDEKKIIEIFKELQFNSLVKKLPEILKKKPGGENLKLW